MPGSDVAAVPAALTPSAPGNGSYLAQLPRVRGPFNVQGPLGLSVCIGVEYAWGHYFVTARGAHGTGTHVIAQFDLSGALLAPPIFQKNTGGTEFGIRDMVVDEAANKLWGGQEGGQIQEYDRVAGTPADTLTFVRVYVIPGQNIVRVVRQ